MTTLFVNHLTVIDASYLDSQRGLIGESWIVDIELTGKLDDQGMIFDFGHVKQQIKTCIDDCVDHKLIVSKQLPHLDIKNNNNQIRLTWQHENYSFYLSSPSSAVIIIDEGDYGSATIEHLIRNAVEPVLPTNVSNFKISLRHEDIQGAYYHYSHGLKKHHGHCQRIAHGHRSRLEIYENGKRSSVWEKFWANKFRDAYLGTREDISATPDYNEELHYQFSYQANDGDFTIELPQKNCYLLDNETTVENIAQHIADQLHSMEPNTYFTVKAFEGVNKGAIVHINVAKNIGPKSTSKHHDTNKQPTDH